MWNWAGAAYPKSTQILDFYHAVEHLSQFAKTYFPTQKEQQKWVDAQRLDLLNDQIDSVIENLDKMDKRTQKGEIERKGLLTYFRNNQSRMLYQTFKDRGLAIGSGAIESAHRTVLQKKTQAIRANDGLWMVLKKLSI